MRRSSLEWLCFFIAVVQRGSSLLRTYTFRTQRIFWHRSMTGSQRGFATGDMRTARAPLDSLLQRLPWRSYVRAHMLATAVRKFASRLASSLIPLGRVSAATSGSFQKWTARPSPAKCHGGGGIIARGSRDDRAGICTSFPGPAMRSRCGRWFRTSLDAADVPPLGGTCDDLSASARNTIERTNLQGGARLTDRSRFRQARLPRICDNQRRRSGSLATGVCGAFSVR
jgi:hypothetical protein